jgi:sugar O-acyltransferase (sialic acid O-acetyltransferase NeuD family)
MTSLAILGAGGHGKVVADAAMLTGKWDEIVFFDDAWPTLKTNGPWSVIGDTQILTQTLVDFNGVVVAIGNNRIRMEMLHRLIDGGANVVTIAHPSAVVSSHASLAPGCVIFAGAVINIGASIGLGAIVNSGATVDHDCTLGDGVHVSPGAHLAGGVTVGDESWIGIGACVRQMTPVGRCVVVGAGAAVVKPVADNMTVVGVPAQELKISRVLGC